MANEPFEFQENIHINAAGDLYEIVYLDGYDDAFAAFLDLTLGGQYAK
ncbi:MAG: hypothetical protein LBG21_02640 [Campylobacteraceae bacterium]|jgi:hypothetical protein|nr:hypothetical protein [Campylobacteraceae bacterium]